MSDLDYWAGVFDTAGRIYDHKLAWRLTIAGNLNRDLVADFHVFVGVGNASPQKPRLPGHSPGLRWEATHRDAFVVAKLLLPYTRRTKAKLQKIVDRYGG